MLLISCLGERTGGGLFAYDGNAMEQLDTLSSTGLAVDGDPSTMQDLLDASLVSWLLRLKGAAESRA